MAHLTLLLLGPPRLDRGGVPVDVDTRKAVALLAYLAVTQQAHSRDTLAALLWPDYDQAHARATLRRTLSTLNKALAGEWMRINRDTIGLDRAADCWVDVDQFRHLLAACGEHGHPASAVCAECLRPLTEAVALYRADFLAGFSLRDSPSFEDWQFFQSQSLRRELAGALERLARCHAAQRSYDAAIASARRWLALDRLHEPAHRQLMLLYAWAGQRAAALRQYRALHGHQREPDATTAHPLGHPRSCPRGQRGERPSIAECPHLRARPAGACPTGARVARPLSPGRALGGVSRPRRGLRRHRRRGSCHRPGRGGRHWKDTPGGGAGSPCSRWRRERGGRAVL
jgi:DNA-binding SARP family transcriptional activator